MSKQSKNAKLNMTIDMEFYEDLKQQAYNEHLPVATYARKLIMDNMPLNNPKAKAHDTR
jgi:hypothetical protein